MALMAPAILTVAALVAGIQDAILFLLLWPVGGIVCAAWALAGDLQRRK